MDYCWKPNYGKCGKKGERCPKNCICPWEEQMMEAAEESAFYYWASEQNRAEDPSGYKQWTETLAN